MAGMTKLATRDDSVNLLVKDEDGYEHLVFAEVLIPNVLNVYGDFHTEQSVREFAYGFMVDGFGIDINHDNVDVSSSIYVVESFIARENDPDFVQGAWVIGLLVKDAEIWDKILTGELTGYSYEAIVTMLPIEIMAPTNRLFSGKTEKNLDNGHFHNYFVLLDKDGRVQVGGTDQAEDGHSHIIRQATVTEEKNLHRHLFTMVK